MIDAIEIGIGLFLAITFFLFRWIFRSCYPALRNWMIDRSFRAYQKQMDALRPVEEYRPPVKQRPVSDRVKMAKRIPDAVIRSKHLREQWGATYDLG